VRGRLRPGEHPAAGEGLWGTEREVPSFLYAMPVGGRRVFLEETCLVAKPALPFAALKRRLHRRLAAMGLKACALSKWVACFYTALLCFQVIARLKERPLVSHPRGVSCDRARGTRCTTPHYFT